MLICWKQTDIKERNIELQKKFMTAPRTTIKEGGFLQVC